VQLEKTLTEFEEKTSSVLHEHTAERERVLHLIDRVAAAGEEIVIRVRQQNTDQVRF